MSAKNLAYNLMRLILDSSAVMAFLQEEDGGEAMKEILRNGQSHELIMSVIQYGEILYASLKYNKAKGVADARLFFQSTRTKIVPATKEQAELAASFKARGGIAYPDCFALALGKLRKATVVTKDKEFRKFSKEVKIRWIG